MVCFGRRRMGEPGRGDSSAITTSRPALPLRARPRVRIPPGVLILASPSWIRTAPNQRPERQPGVFSRLPDEVVRPYSTCMEIENSILAPAEPRNVPLTGAASNGSLEAATATWEAARSEEHTSELQSLR